MPIPFASSHCLSYARACHTARLDFYDIMLIFSFNMSACKSISKKQTDKVYLIVLLHKFIVFKPCNIT